MLHITVIATVPRLALFSPRGSAHSKSPRCPASLERVRRQAAEVARYTLDFPLNPPRALPPTSSMPLDLVSFIKGLLARLTVDWRRVTAISHSATTAKLIVEVDSEAVVARDSTAVTMGRLRRRATS